MQQWWTYLQQRPYLLPLAGLVLIAAVLARTAWLADDAYISFRAVDNLLNGHGLRWNIDERVQTFTNPLWTLVVGAVYFCSGEIFYSALLFSAAVSLLAIGVFLFRIAAGAGAVLLSVVLIVSSRAFIDFSTSGLENPLTHLLLALFLWLFLAPPKSGRPLFWLSLLSALAVCNRMDTILLVGPSLAWAMWQNRQHPRQVAVALTAWLPFVLWELFALAYYGFLLPNTAYAKLNTGIPALELAGQGMRYLVNSLVLDPLTLVAVIAALIIAVQQKSRPAQAIALGLGLYLLYIVKIGGDFMNGRFLAAPFFVALGVLARLNPLPTPKAWAIAAGAVLLVGLARPNPPLLSGPDYGRAQEDFRYMGVVDQRREYYQYTGLLPALADTSQTPFPSHPAATLGRQVQSRGLKAAGQGRYPLVATTAGDRLVTTWLAVGWIAFYAGPQVHVIDAYGLGDPLLARLPAAADSAWIAGHFTRILPAGYKASHVQGRNQIADPNLARYWDQLRLVTQGPIWTKERWGAIWQFHTGGYQYLIDTNTYRHPTPLEAALSQTRIKRDPTAYLAVAQAYYQQKETDKAHRAIATALALSPDSILNLGQAGDLHWDHHHRDQAIALYRRAIRAFRLAQARSAQFMQWFEHTQSRAKRFATFLHLGRALFRTGESQRGLDMVRKALALDPTNAEGHTTLGNLLYQSDQFATAESSYRQALETGPESRAQFGLGLALLGQGKTAAAVAAFADAIRRFGPEAAVTAGAVAKLQDLAARGIAIETVNQLLKQHWP